ncbi:MAG TPA: Hsp20/alpha crystallin family protein [Steroidobacteraceae bacterium]|jgi:HSP20 family protein|nr:Hsp20/alpha crystallin family protein [Steroidobacteraceae bacterium]
MALLRYEPWNMMERLHRQIDQIFGDTFSTPAASGEGAVEWIPSVDIHEEPDKFVVRADLPGVQSKDISVTADNGVLTLSGQRRSEQREHQQGFSRIEHVDGAFLRRFTLPENVKTDDIRAHHSNGVLEVTIPKVQAPEPRRVNVETH